MCNCEKITFFAGTIAFSFARFGQGTGPILLDDLLCTSRETRLIDCPNRGIGVHNCRHYEDAGVRCQRKLSLVPLTSEHQLLIVWGISHY